MAFACATKPEVVEVVMSRCALFWLSVNWPLLPEYEYGQTEVALVYG